MVKHESIEESMKTLKKTLKKNLDCELTPNDTILLEYYKKQAK